MKTRSLSYKAVFFIAGVAFALATTYIVAALVYQAESYRATLDAAPGADFLATATSLLRVRLLAFLPWVLGTIGIFIALGYSFDTQIRLRRKAELLQARAEALAVTDGLTLLYNRTYFIDQLDLEIRRTKRRSYTFSLLFVDIDEFKKYNDIHGHLEGDGALRRVALALKATVRDTDLVARYGGEEFVVIAVGADKHQAAGLAERIREEVLATCSVTASIGVASYPADGATVDDLIKAADVGMYGAKGSGKNRVCIAPDGPGGSDPLNGPGVA